jgi:hypothetical protein
MDYTPRQMQAYLFLSAKRRQTDLRDQLHVNTLAARGDEQAIRGQLRDLDDA